MTMICAGYVEKISSKRGLKVAFYDGAKVSRVNLLALLLFAGLCRSVLTSSYLIVLPLAFPQDPD